MENYYALLNVSPDADFDEVKRAYRRCVHLYHPDANGGVGDTEKFKNVVKAYQYLEKHHKTKGIKPVRPKKGILVSLMEGIRSSFARERSEPAAKKTEPSKMRRRVWKDEFADMDPLVLQLSFEELKLRFTESDNDFVKRQSARALTYLFGAGALSLLKPELKCAGAALSEEIIRCLGIVGDRESILLIEKYLRHPEVKVACAAVKALQSINQGYARTLLERVEKEGRTLRLALFNLFGNSAARKMVRSGIMKRSELHVARFLHWNTGQPMPIILEELGFVEGR